MKNSKQVLFITTKAKTVTTNDGGEYPSGVWGEEFAIPYEKFKKAGYQIDVATINGIPPIIDQSSMSVEYQPYFRPKGAYESDSELVSELWAIINEVDALKSPLNVNEFTKEEIKKYEAVFFVGGHGCLEDTTYSEDTSNIAKWFTEEDKIVGIVCHGACGILNATDDDGNFFFKDYEITCMADTEEQQTQLWGKMPFVLQHKLEELGVKYSKTDVNWGSYVAVDRNIVSGQNPYSSKETADIMLQEIQKRNS